MLIESLKLWKIVALGGFPFCFRRLRSNLI